MKSSFDTVTTISEEFSAAHFYYVEGWSKEENEATFGKCARREGHGHNYTVEVTVRPSTTGSAWRIRQNLSGVLASVDHKNLNLDTPYFKNLQPTTENIALLLFSMAREAMGSEGDLVRLRLFESDDLWAVTEDGQNVALGRRVSFSASHRLWTPALSEEENERIFGKCANANGHGHNYVLEVEVSGAVDPRTGFVIALPTLDAALGALVNEWDHTRLDTHCPDFRTVNPTGENIATVAYRRLQTALPHHHLTYLRLWETRNIFFEVLPETGSRHT